MAAVIRSHDCRDPFERLSPRERQVAVLAGGNPTLKDKEVAQALSIQISTVRAHMRVIRAALDIRGRGDLARLVDKARQYEEFLGASGGTR